MEDVTVRNRTAWSDTFRIDLRESRVVVAGRARVGTFDLNTGKQLTAASSIAPADSNGGPWISDVAWLDERTVLALTSGAQIVRVDIDTQKPTASPIDIRLTDPVDFDVSPNGDRIAVASSEGVGIWSLRGDRLLARAAPRGTATVGSLSPSGSEFTAFPGDGLLYAPQQVTHREIAGSEVAQKPVPQPAGIYRYLDQSPLLFSISAFGDVTSWDASSGKAFSAYDVRSTWTSVAVSSDGQWIAFGAPGARVFDTATGKQVALFTALGRPVRSLSFSPDRTRLVVADGEGRSAKVFDTSTTALVSEIASQNPIVAVRYSPNGSTLATVDDTGQIALRDPLTFEIQRTLVGSYEGSIGDSPLWFSDDGRVLLSGSPRQAALWDLETGVQIGDPFPNDAGFKLDGVDGPHLLTAVDDHLLLWNLDTASWPALACRAAGRNLTSQEWSQFGPANEPYQVTCPQFPALG